MKGYKNFKTKYVILIQALLFIGGATLSYNGKNYLSSILFMVLSLGSYLYYYVETKNLIHPVGVYSIAWLGGIGLSCLKLSKLSNRFEIETWICFFIAYFIFSICYMLGIRNTKTIIKGDKSINDLGNNTKNCGEQYICKKNRILLSILIITMVSVLGMLFEWKVRGFLPILSNMPHAYSYFHVSGVHYFTVSFVLVPSLSIIYIMLDKDLEIKNSNNGFNLIKNFLKLNIKEKLIIVSCDMLAVIIPLLIVSRFQLLFGVILAVIIFLYMNKNFKIRYIIIIGFLLIAAWVVLTIFRNHSPEYLNKIFEFKNKNTPIFITQPYMYVCNNFENFNLMVKNIGINGINKAVTHTLGLKMLFPIFAFTGLKFKCPSLVPTTIFITKTELTTLTLYYDSYFDFGIVGVFALAALFGFAIGKISEKTKKNKNPIMILILAQLIMYAGMAFFTTWFSNPATWFYLGLSVIIFLFVRDKREEDV